MRSIEEENYQAYQEYKQYEYETVTVYWIGTIIFVSSAAILIAGIMLAYLFQPDDIDSHKCLKLKEYVYLFAIMLIFGGIVQLGIFAFGLASDYIDQINLYGKIQKYQRIEQGILLLIYVIIEAYVYQTKRHCKVNQTYYSLYALYFWSLCWFAFVYNFEDLT